MFIVKQVILCLSCCLHKNYGGLMKQRGTALLLIKELYGILESLEFRRGGLEPVELILRILFSFNFYEGRPDGMLKRGSVPFL